MNENVLSRRLIKHVKSFQHFFLLTKNSLGYKDIHLLRVSIKKIRALLSLLQVSTFATFEKGQFLQIFLPVFKMSGELREIQVSLRILRKLKDPNIKPYIDYLLEKQPKIGLSLLLEMNIFDTRKLTEMVDQFKLHSIPVSYERICTISIRSVLRRMKRIEKFRIKLDDEKNLHKIRILLKEIHEVLSLYNSIKPNQNIQSLLKKIGSLNTKIGNWHDLVNLTDSLPRFIHKNSNKYHSMNTALKKLSRRKDNILQSIKINIAEEFRYLAFSEILIDSQ